MEITADSCFPECLYPGVGVGRTGMSGSEDEGPVHAPFLLRSLLTIYNPPPPGLGTAHL